MGPLEQELREAYDRAINASAINLEFQTGFRQPPATTEDLLRITAEGVKALHEAVFRLAREIDDMRIS